MVPEVVAPRRTLALRDYQVEALAAIKSAALRGVNRQLVCLPTGTGKTVVFSHLARQRAGRVLILAHRDELIQQAVAKLREVAPGMTVGIALERRPKGSPPPRVLVGSVQALSLTKRLAQGVPTFRTVIVDEAHHAPAPSYHRLLSALGAFDAGGPLVVGFTATPTREDARPLSGVWEEIVYKRELVDMISRGYLTDLRALQIRLATDFAALPTVRGDIDQEAVGVLLRDMHVPDLIATTYVEHARRRPGLVFAPTVAIAADMAAAFQLAGIPAAAVSGKTPAKERRRLLADFNEGRLQVVVNCGVLTEGFDSPRVSCVVIARPTRSKGLYVQMIGRGTRLHPSKADCLVLDIAGATRSHDLVTSASLFSAEADFAEGHTLREHEARAARDRLPKGITQGDTEVKGGDQVTDAFAEPVHIFHGGQLQWMGLSEDLYVLPIPKGYVALKREGDRWGAFYSVDNKRKALGVDLDLTWAQGVAEDYVRSVGATWLDPAAKWRNASPSAAQMGLLRRLGVPIPDGCTRGQASDLITAQQARAAASEPLGVAV